MSNVTGGKLVYTYDVFWEMSNIGWASRWDAYLKMPGGRVHWFSIANSLMVRILLGFGIGSQGLSLGLGFGVARSPPFLIN